VRFRVRNLITAVYKFGGGFLVRERLRRSPPRNNTFQEGHCEHRSDAISADEHTRSYEVVPRREPNEEQSGMNRHRIEGNYKQVKGRIVETWGRLTHSYSSVLRGKMSRFIGKIQSKFGRMMK